MHCNFGEWSEYYKIIHLIVHIRYNNSGNTSYFANYRHPRELQNLKGAHVTSPNLNANTVSRERDEHVLSISTGEKIQPFFFSIPLSLLVCKIRRKPSKPAHVLINVELRGCNGLYNDVKANACHIMLYRLRKF